MAKDRNNVRVWGDDTGGVWVASKGTTGPTGLGPPPTGFVELGWMQEDGSTVARSMENTDVLSVGGTLLRRIITSVDDTVQIGCLEENAAVVGLYYRGAPITVTTGVASMTVANQKVSDERAWIFDWYDTDSIQKRIVAPAGEVTEIDTLTHSKQGPVIYIYTVTLYGDYELISNSPGLVAA